jgi:hypothetical protein
MTTLQTMTAPAFHPGPMADRPDPEVPRTRPSTHVHRPVQVRRAGRVRHGRARRERAILRQEGFTPRTWWIGGLFAR